MHWAKLGGKHRTRRFDPEHSPATWTERQRAEIEELLDRDRSGDAGIPAGRQPGQRPHRRLRGAGAVSRGREAHPRRLVRPGARLRARRRARGRGDPRGARAPSAAPTRSTWRSTSVPPRSAPTSVSDALQGNLEGLIIEITEHEFVPDDESLAAAIADLRERGAMIAIDDAGRGACGPQAADAGAAGHRQDRPRPRPRHRPRPGADGAGRVVRPLRERRRRDRLRRGHRDARGARRARRSRRQWGQGWVLARPEPPWAEVSPSRRRGLPDRARGHLSTRCPPSGVGSAPAIAAWCTSAPASPRRARARTWRRRSR